MTVSGSPPATSTTITGLTNGTTYTFSVTATNVMGTSTASSPSNPATPVSAPEACPCTIFGSQAPATPDSGDGSPVNVGTAFTTDTSGYVTGMRFYKAAANTGTHVGSLWSASGTLLAQATFTGETASGWQQVTLLDPGGGDRGHHVRRVVLRPQRALRADAQRPHRTRPTGPPLYTLASANAPNGNGVFTYAIDHDVPRQHLRGHAITGSTPSTPRRSPSVPAAPTGVTATAGNGSATVSWTPPPGTVTSYTVTPYVGSTRAHR